MYKKIIQTIGAILIFFVIPVFLYFYIREDPIFSYDENGRPTQFGIPIMLIIFWLGGYLTIRGRLKTEQSQEKYNTLKRLVKQHYKKSIKQKNKAKESDDLEESYNEEFDNFIGEMDEKVEEEIEKAIDNNYLRGRNN